MSNSRKIILLLIIVASFLIRTTIWFSSFSTDGPTFESQYTSIASSFDPSNELSFFYHPHSIYVVYPLYLSPIYLFGLDAENYIFCLHHFFAASTILLIFGVASKFGGSGAGLLAALVYAFQLQTAFWFYEADAITALHFQLALFMHCSLMCWERASRKRVVLFVITGLMLPLTRPEAAAYLVVSSLILAFRWIAPRIGAMRTLAVCLGFVLVFLLSGIYVLKQNNEIREAVYSHYHMGLLYWATQEIPTEMHAHEEKQAKMQEFCGVRAVQDPERRSGWYWCTMTGLEAISNDPLNYITLLSKNFLNQLYPSFFRDNWSWKNKLFDRSNMSFIIMGVIFIFVFNSKEKFGMIGLILMALVCFIGLSYSAILWDVRTSLSPHVLLIPVASVGWIRFANLAYGRFLRSETA